MKSWDFHIRSNTDDILAVSERIQNLCQENNICSPNSCSIRLVVVEALNNVREHSYLNNPERYISIYLSFASDFVLISVSDTGVANTKGIDPIEHVFTLDEPDTIPEGGFGFNIIHTLMDEISYHTQENVNTLTLKKYWKKKR